MGKPKHLPKVDAKIVKKPDVLIGVDHDYETKSGLILRCTAVIRGKDGCIEYINLSDPANPGFKRVPRDTFQGMVTKHLGYKGSVVKA